MSEGDNKTPESVSFDEHTKVVQELAKSRERAQKFEGELTDVQKTVEKFGKYDLEKLTADSSALKELMQKNAAGDDDAVAKLLSDAEATHKSEMARVTEEYEGKLGGLNKQIHESNVVDKVMGEIGKNFNDDTHSFIKDMVRTSVSVNDAGEFIITDKEGKERYNHKHTPMTLGEYASEISEQHPSFARATMQPGTKQPGHKMEGVSMDVHKYMKLSPQQKLQLPVKDQHALATEAVKHMSFKRE